MVDIYIKTNNSENKTVEIKKSRIESRARVVFDNENPKYYLSIKIKKADLNGDLFFKATDLVKNVKKYFINNYFLRCDASKEHFKNINALYGQPNKMMTVDGEKTNKIATCFQAKLNALIDEAQSNKTGFYYFNSNKSTFEPLSTMSTQTENFKKNISIENVYFKVSRNKNGQYELSRSLLSFTLRQIDTDRPKAPPLWEDDRDLSKVSDKVYAHVRVKLGIQSIEKFGSMVSDSYTRGAACFK